MDAALVRRHIYDRIVERGTSPKIDALATFFGVDADTARRAVANLNIGKTVLIDPRSGELWMAGPFSAVPTDYRVTGARAEWFANCAWDMLGIAVIANERVRVETHCCDCGERMTFDVDPRTGPTLDAIVHFLVPARRWYDDIGFT